MKIFLRILLPIIALSCGAVAIKWLMANKPEQKKRPSFETLPVIEASPLARQNVPLTIQTQGVVRPRLRTSLVSQIRGRIVEVADNLRDGGTFKKDDVLIRIEASDYEVAVATAEANLIKAQLMVAELRLQDERANSNIAVAQAEVAKAQVVVDEETARAKQAAQDWQRLHPDTTAPDLVIRKPQLDSANASVVAAKAMLTQSRLDKQLATARTKTAEATVAVSKSALEKEKLDLARTVVRAPYDGRILTQEVDLGRFVSPGTVLAAVYPVEEAEVRLPCSNTDLTWITIPGATVTLKTQNSDHSWTGSIIRTEGAFDSQTRQLSLIATIEAPFVPGPNNRPALHVGQFLTAEIAGTTLNDHYEIPRSAIRSGNEILLVDANSMLSRHTIEPVFSDRSRVIIGGDLPDNVRLCTTPIAFATPNKKVHVKGDPKPKRGNPKTGKSGEPSGKKPSTHAKEGRPTP